jgi:predicted aminopeptidase
LEPVESCFVIVGCLDYRGYFKRDDAYAYGAGLEGAGYDVWVAGVAAYSTLGWFDDPVLNTMIRWEDARLVKVIFHELAHQVVYVSDDTEFNESFATAVADIGYQRWAATGSGATASVDESVQRDAEFHQMLLAHRERLADIYGSAAAEQRKREQKAAVFAAIYADYRSLKDSWQGYDGYDDWMTDLNNAKLAAVATYHVYVPVFQTILEVTGGDLQVFFAVAREFARRSAEYRDTCMTRQLENADGSAVDCIDELVESARSAAR